MGGLAGHGDKPGLRGMLELTVAAACSNDLPPVPLDEPDDLTDLHVLPVGPPDLGVKTGQSGGGEPHARASLELAKIRPA